MGFSLFNQSGLSMVQGLVVGAVMAGSSLVATRLIQDQKKLMKATETRGQIEQLHQMIYTTLQNREHCMQTLANNSITSAAVGNAPRTVSAIWSKVNTSVTPAQRVFEVNDGSTMAMDKIYMNGNISIKSMSFVVPQASDPAGQNVITYPSRLRVTYSRMESKNANLRTKEGYGAKLITKDIAIVLQRNTTSGNIDGCYAVQLGDTTNGVTVEGNNNLNQEFCSNLGKGGSLYIWDSQANKCILKNNVCPDKYVFAGINSTGNAMCYPLNNYLNHMIDTSTISNCNTSSGGTVALTTDSLGRVKITCNVP